MTTTSLPRLRLVDRTQLLLRPVIVERYLAKRENCQTCPAKPVSSPTDAARSLDRAHRTPNVEKVTLSTSWPCPRCGGTMIVIERLTMYQIRFRAFPMEIVFDTS